MANNEFKKYGTDTAIEIIKQLITLASAFIVITASVVKLFFDGTSTSSIEWFILAILAWGFAIVSISSGILSLGGISTSAHDHEEYNVDAFYQKWGMRIQQLAFVLMFVFFIIFTSVNAYD